MNISNNHINGLLEEMLLSHYAVTPCYDMISHSHCFGLTLATDQVVALGIAIGRVIGGQELVDTLGSEAVIEPHGPKAALVFWPGVMCPDWEGVKKSFAETYT